jgi:putative Mn2+ efflux pump MntP
MQLITLLFLAMSLCVDSFAVSISCGLILNSITFWKATRIGFSLAFFQALMPLIGWFIGKRIEFIISSFGYWLTFSLLVIIGARMIFESLKKDKEAKNKINPLDMKVLLGMSIATSIDALVVGISFAFINVNLYLMSFIIGFTTFFFSMLGILFGKKIGLRFGNKMEITGGIVLIVIGLKVLADHYLLIK